ncbi:hypothetical protein I3W98_34695, partial [Streptomyces cavourensis]|nr:hypothetical protein [Streptomyces cavourensis]
PRCPVPRRRRRRHCRRWRLLDGFGVRAAAAVLAGWMVLMALAATFSRPVRRATMTAITAPAEPAPAPAEPRRTPAGASGAGSDAPR